VKKSSRKILQNALEIEWECDDEDPRRAGLAWIHRVQEAIR
jgi:hypothetical protein